MEFLGRLFKKVDKKQQALLREMGVEGEIVETFVGPDYEKGPTVQVDNQKFLEVLESKGKTEFRKKLVNQSDTHQAFHLFLNIGEVWLKTPVAAIDYSQKENLISQLHKKGFKSDPSSSKEDWSTFCVY